MQSGVFLDDFLGYVIYAEKISADRTSFENVMLAPGGENKREHFTLLAPSGSISGSVETGDLRLSLDYGIAYSTRQGSDKLSVLKFTRAEIDLLRIFQEQIAGNDTAEDDFRSYRPSELVHFIDQLANDPKRDEGLYRRARYLLHKRIGSPFAVVTFAFFGMVLGISDPRRGKSAAYVGAIGTVIGGYILMMGFGWLAEAGHLEPAAAAWLPNILLIALGYFLVYQKNRLPPSEGTLDRRNLPFLSRARPRPH